MAGMCCQKFQMKREKLQEQRSPLRKHGYLNLKQKNKNIRLIMKIEISLVVFIVLLGSSIVSRATVCRGKNRHHPKIYAHRDLVFAALLWQNILTRWIG